MSENKYFLSGSTHHLHLLDFYYRPIFLLQKICIFIPENIDHPPYAIFSMINVLKALHEKLVGGPEQASLEARIFHEISLIAIIALFFYLGVNLFTKVPFVSVVMFSGMVLMTLLYVNSRYWGNLKSSIILFTIAGNALLVANYFLNSGINGPTLLIFTLSFFFTISVMPKKEYRMWFFLNIVVVLSLLTIEYLNPHLVKNSYINRISYFTDTAFSYVVIVGIISIIITYIRKSYEYEKNSSLEKSQELQQANESKTKLLSILSHDLRSPLNSIQSFLEILIEYKLEEDEKKAIKMSLLKETKNTQTMLQNLLSWTKSQMEGGVRCNLTNINLFDVLKITIDIQQTAAQEKAIKIRNEIDPSAVVLADVDMIKLVVRNIINNAVKFTRQGGEILLKTEIVNNEFLLSIQDNGIGISKDKQQYLFSYESTSTYGTKNEKGIGLGLLLCKEFTELQGGKISYTSIDQKGTTFTITFPSYETASSAISYAS